MDQYQTSTLSILPATHSWSHLCVCAHLHIENFNHMHTGQFHVHNTQFALPKTLPNRSSYRDMHNLENESLILARSHDTLPQWLTKMEPRLALCTTTLGNPRKLLDYLWESSIVFRSCQNLFGTVQKSSEFFRNWGYMDMKITPMWISKTMLGVVKF